MKNGHFVSQLQFGSPPAQGFYPTKGISIRTVGGQTYLMATTKQGRITEFYGKLLDGPIRLGEDGKPLGPSRFAEPPKNARILLVHHNSRQIDMYVYEKLAPSVEADTREKVENAFREHNLLY